VQADLCSNNARISKRFPGLPDSGNDLSKTVEYYLNHFLNNEKQEIFWKSAKKDHAIQEKKTARLLTHAVFAVNARVGTALPPQCRSFADRRWPQPA
jgi:hypothetical protein